MKDNTVVINQIFIASNFDEMVKIEALVEDVCATYLDHLDVYGNVLIALTEAVNNAILHGNKSDNNKRVEVSVELTDDCVEFCVKDQGNGFDYENLPDPTAPENIEKENGRGIFLMKSLSDEVVFEEGGSIVKISFNR